MHQPSGLSVNAALFQPQPVAPASRLVEAGGKGLLNDHPPPGHTTTSSVGNMPSPVGGPYSPTSDDDVTSDGGLVDPSSHRRVRGSRGSRGSWSGEGSGSSHPTQSSTSSRGRRKRKMDSLAKSRYPSLVGKRATRGTLLMPSDSGLGASRPTEITTRTHV